MGEKGRSMVEMLGVLAIIGVLSVGAISGYSKAMLKYKLNKYSENLSILFFNVQALRARNENLEDIDVRYYVPEELVSRFQSSRLFFDTFGNYWGLYNGTLYTRPGKTDLGGGGGIYTRSDDVIRSSCPTLILTARDAHAKEIRLNHYTGYMSFCDKGCQRKVSDLTVNVIQDFCETILHAQNGDAIVYFHF